MTIKYLKYVKKYCVSYKGRAVAVGDTYAQAIEEALNLIRLKVIK